MLLAPARVQCIPERLRRVPIATLHPASRTPDELQRPFCGTVDTACDGDYERCKVCTGQHRRSLRHEDGAHGQ
jgi:hypothetical protein